MIRMPSNVFRVLCISRRTFEENVFCKKDSHVVCVRARRSHKVPRSASSVRRVRTQATRIEKRAYETTRTVRARLRKETSDANSSTLFEVSGMNWRFSRPRLIDREDKSLAARAYRGRRKTQVVRSASRLQRINRRRRF